MQNLLLTALLVSASLCPLYATAAPVEVRLAANCESVTGIHSSASDGASIRVRKGGVLAASGSQQTIYVDRGATAEITGTNSKVYLEDGASATVVSDGNTVYKHKDAAVTSTGDNRVSDAEGYDVWVHEQNSTCRKL